MASIEDEFTKRNCKLIGLSIDSVEDHNLWKDIEDVQGTSVNYPLIADEDLKLQNYTICFQLKRNQENLEQQ